MTIRLSRRQAAQISIIAQHLARSLRRRADAEMIHHVIKRLACLQIDTISVVARSHYLVLWSRVGAYDTELLDRLHFPDQNLFEYWAHAASLIDTDLLPAFLPRMRRNRIQYGPVQHTWAAENASLLDEVHQHVRKNGPVTSLHFDRPNPDEPVPPWAWWGGKPANRALDLLWTTGQLGIRRRISFRREYDILERILPQICEQDVPDVCQERLTLAERALQAMGICRPEWLNDYFRTRWGTRNDHPPGPRELLAQLAKRDRAIPVVIDGLGDAYVSIDQTQTLDHVQRGYRATHTTFLSPFDNLIWDRQRTKELFDFEYRIECYTPAHQRRYGYFCLPILHRGRLVGRMDPKIDRRTGRFIVRALHLEPGIRISNRLVTDVSQAIHSFSRWHGGKSVEFENGPPAIREAAESTLA